MDSNILANLELISGITIRIENEINQLKAWVKAQYELNYNNLPIHTTLDSTSDEIVQVKLPNESSKSAETQEDQNQIEENFPIRNINKNTSITITRIPISNSKQDQVTKASEPIVNDQFKESQSQSKEIAITTTTTESKKTQKFVCHFNFCSKQYQYRYQLKRHLVSHSEKIISCNVCHKIFKSSSNLNDHRLKVHQKNVNLKCPVYSCTFRCRKYTALEYHNQLAHIGRKCSWCDKTFFNRTSIFTHVERDHLVCAIVGCKAQFKSKNELLIHKELSHPNPNRNKKN